MKTDDHIFTLPRRWRSDEGPIVREIILKLIPKHCHVTRTVDNLAPNTSRDSIGRTLGSNDRKFALCEESSWHKGVMHIRFWFVDLITGTMYDPHTLGCRSSDFLRLEP